MRMSGMKADDSLIAPRLASRYAVLAAATRSTSRSSAVNDRIVTMPATLLASSAPRSPAACAHLGVAGLEAALVAHRRPHDQRDRGEGHDAQHRLGHEEDDADEQRR